MKWKWLLKKQSFIFGGWRIYAAHSLPRGHKWKRWSLECGVWFWVQRVSWCHHGEEFWLQMVWLLLLCATSWHFCHHQNVCCKISKGSLRLNWFWGSENVNLVDYPLYIVQYFRLADFPFCTLPPSSEELAIQFTCFLLQLIKLSGFSMLWGKRPNKAALTSSVSAFSSSWW